MKVGRRKKANRILTFYRYRFNYLPPYSVLMDGTFCQAALQFKLNLREQLPKYLGAEVEIFTTTCVIHEMEELGGELRGALAVAKEYRLAKCPHKPLRSAVECLKHMARRSRQPDHTKYFIATQDNSLLESVREIAGVPLLSIRYNTILLEKPSEESVAASDANNQKKELEKVRQLKVEVFGEQKKRKKKGGPNPMSCKKKKVKPQQQQQNRQESASEKNRKRKRVRKRKSKSDGGGNEEADGPAAKKPAPASD